MFEQTFIAPASSRRDRKIALALAIQTVAITVLAVVPMLSVERIDVSKRFIILPPARLAAAPEQRAAASQAPAKASVRYMRIQELSSRVVPTFHVSSADLPEAPDVSGSVQAGSAADGILGGMGSIGIASSPLQARPTAKIKVEQGPVRVTSSLTQSHLVFGPKPPYPRLAASARIEGSVRLQAIISRDGRIENLRVLSGHPLLVGAAMEAVKQWRYQPVRLNGDAVDVITEIDVNFTLHD